MTAPNPVTALNAALAAELAALYAEGQARLAAWEQDTPAMHEAARVALARLGAAQHATNVAQRAFGTWDTGEE